jgi:hypothetical protein
MKIKLISPELHAELTKIATDHPELVFANDGYEYIGSRVRDEKAEQIARIEAILKEHILGFSRFFNFYPQNGKRGLTLRFDYSWGESENTRYFIGLGYLELDHLRDGSPEIATQA